MNILEIGNADLVKPAPWWVGGRISCSGCGFKCELEADDKPMYDGMKCFVTCPTCGNRLCGNRPMDYSAMENVPTARPDNRKFYSEGYSGVTPYDTGWQKWPETNPPDPTDPLAATMADFYLCAGVSEEGVPVLEICHWIEWRGEKRWDTTRWSPLDNITHWRPLPEIPEAVKARQCPTTPT